MDLNATWMFVNAVQAGSLSAAAARLGLPLPTLSRRIRALERELKVQLLERSARGVLLTDPGMRLYELASRGIEILAEGEATLRSDQSRLKGRLRLSVPPSFEPWWELVRGFQAQFPDIRVSVYSTERRVDLVQDGIDVAMRVGALADESMVARRVVTYRHVLVASPALIERLGAPTSVKDLHRFPSAMWMPAHGARLVWQLGSSIVEPEPLLVTNDYAHLRRRAVCGDVVTELPPFLASSSLADGTLQPLLPRCPLPEQEIHLLFPSHRHPSTLVRTYLDFCQQHLPRLLAPAPTERA